MKIKQIYGALAVIIIGLVGYLAISGYYFHTHFHRNTTINKVNVGGLTAKQALAKVKAQKLTNRVYLNGKLVYDGADTTAHFSASAETTVARQLKDQASLLPTSAKHAYNLKQTGSASQASAAKMKAALAKEIDRQNQGKTLPVDAKAVWHANQITVTPAKQGTALDKTKLLAAFDQQKDASTIKLTAKVQKPLSAKSSEVQHQKAALKKLTNGAVNYQVVGHSTKIKADQVIDQATYQNGKYHFTAKKSPSVIAKLNKQYATLGKKFKFTTHSGSQITTNGLGDYGWKIMASRAASSIGQAIVDGDQSIDAKSDIYGQGYDTRGIGYGVTKNDGIGDTYVEVSIADQQAWFYKDGKQVFAANVVTGKHSAGDDTSKGVWYIMYQQTNTTLRGTGDNGKPYASPVNYWSPFTLSGEGFHDASWRTNWSKTAYLNNGSNGCVNMHPSDAGTAYKAMSPKEPVVIY